MSLVDGQNRGGLLTERGRRRAGSNASIWAVAGGALAMLTASEVTFGQSPPVLELSWDAPPQCPQGESVQDRIRALIGSTEVRPDQLRAEGQIARSGDKYRLTLVVRSGSASGTRTLESDSCDHLVGAAAVALGLLVRLARAAAVPLTSEALSAPSAEGGEPRTNRPETAARREPALSNKPVPSPPLSDHAGTDQNFRVLLRAPSIELGLGSLPGLSFGYAAGAGASYADWQALLTGVFWPKRTSSSELPGFDVAATRYSVSLDGCRAWHLGSFEWFPCLRAGLVHIDASSTGKGIIPLTASTSVFSAGAVLGTKLHMSRWVALFLTASGELQTYRPRLMNEGVGELYRFPLGTMKFGLGTEWVF